MTRTYNKNSLAAVLGIALCLFVIPFFWLKPGFVDLGGDSGRLYFIDPLATAISIFNHWDVVSWVPSFSMVPYQLFLYGLSFLIPSPTNLINFERGIQLSFSFLFTYLIVFELLHKEKKAVWIGIATGIMYILMISKIGWTLSLVTHNQVFLNPLLFFFLLKYLLSSSYLWGGILLLVTLIYSGNFGFSAAPQVFSFFPLSIIFLLFFVRSILHKEIPWKKLLLLIVGFLMLHGFHLIPLALTFFNPTAHVNSYVFSNKSIQTSGVHYFDVNHESIGKISTNLFQPTIIAPIFILIALIIQPSIQLLLTSIFFSITLFLVSANITHIGVAFYRHLFYIPGFMMFRSFDDKWYWVFSFFYCLLFAFALNRLLKKYVPLISIVLIVIFLSQMIPFFQGKKINSPHFQSNNVLPVFVLDPDLIDSISFIKTMPNQGKFLTLPLTFSYIQIAYGKEGGAYAGVSLIQNIARRDDYAGFWSMGDLAEPVFNHLRANDMDSLLEHFQELDIKYIFYNSDTRIIDNFPDYPYIYPGLMYSSKDQVPAIRDQQAYKELLTKLPIIKLYQKGFYTIYEIHY